MLAFLGKGHNDIAQESTVVGKTEYLLGGVVCAARAVPELPSAYSLPLGRTIESFSYRGMNSSHQILSPTPPLTHSVRGSPDSTVVDGSRVPAPASGASSTISKIFMTLNEQLELAETRYQVMIIFTEGVVF